MIERCRRTAGRVDGLMAVYPLPLDGSVRTLQMQHQCVFSRWSPLLNFDSNHHGGTEIPSYKIGVKLINASATFSANRSICLFNREALPRRTKPPAIHRHTNLGIGNNGNGKTDFVQCVIYKTISVLVLPLVVQGHQQFAVGLVGTKLMIAFSIAKLVVNAKLP